MTEVGVFSEQTTPGLLPRRMPNRTKTPCKCRRPGAAGITGVRRRNIGAVTNLDPHVNHRDGVDWMCRARM
ncbi:hypothetical protein BDZ89DRAFT_1072188 [Hymenopellis radicata]|nr:hypothetical protein BDZ89DRAFT_1077998 [Hymenopellis radicata]KAF9020564.1 hypothetical protein BDZ89DRAFT_1072188 [Hymenopellis radicata]